jgi:hypothetical protein
MRNVERQAQEQTMSELQDEPEIVIVIEDDDTPQSHLSWLPRIPQIEIDWEGFKEFMKDVGMVVLVAGWMLVMIGALYRALRIHF